MELMHHQSQAVSLAEKLPDLGLFWDMGTGKTCTSIQIVKEHERVLILSPLITLQNWKREFKKFSDIPDYRTIAPCKRGAARAKEIAKAIELKSRVIIINYEALQTKAIYDLLKAWSPEAVVCDECHVLKNPQSKRLKLVLSITDNATRRLMLTGTPIPNSPLDIWAQYRVLDGGETLGKNFFKFRGEFFYDENHMRKGTRGYFPSFKPRPTTYERLNKLIYSKAIRVRKEDCLDLPPLVEPDPIEVEMSPDQAKAYESMRKEYIAFIEDLKTKEQKAVVAEIALTKALRLQQIASGFVKTDDGSIVTWPECPRVKATAELVEQIVPEHKLIIWAVFHENYKMLENMLTKMGIEFRAIYGGQKQEDRDRGMNDFENDSRVRVMIANPKAGGVGVNLVAASYSLVYSRGFSLTDELQSQARNYRKGSEQHEKITRLNLSTPGTIDELVVKALMEKQNISEKILEWKL